MPLAAVGRMRIHIANRRDPPLPVDNVRATDCDQRAILAIDAKEDPIIELVGIKGVRCIGAAKGIERLNAWGIGRPQADRLFASRKVIRLLPTHPVHRVDHGTREWFTKTIVLSQLTKVLFAGADINLGRQWQFGQCFAHRCRCPNREQQRQVERGKE